MFHRQSAFSARVRATPTSAAAAGCSSTECCRRWHDGTAPRSASVGGETMPSWINVPRAHVTINFPPRHREIACRYRCSRLVVVGLRVAATSFRYHHDERTSASLALRTDARTTRDLVAQSTPEHATHCFNGKHVQVRATASEQPSCRGATTERP